MKKQHFTIKIVWILSLFFLFTASASSAKSSENSSSIEIHPHPTSGSNPSADAPPTTMQNTAKFRPYFAIPIIYYTPETKFAAGLLQIFNLSLDAPGKVSHITTVLSYTQMQQSNVLISPKLYYLAGQAELQGNINYSYFPNKYYGRAELQLSEPELYTENSFASSISWGHRLYKDFLIRAGVGYDKKNIVSVENAPQLENQFLNGHRIVDVFSQTLSIEWDDRDYPLAPFDGSWYKMAWTQSNVFTRTEVDLRHYQPLGPKRLLASQIYVAEVRGDKIPFQYDLSIGGPQRLRGFYAGRFRDHSLAMIQEEYRRDINDKWSLAFFLSAAKLADKTSDLDLGPTRWTGGIGAHYIVDPLSRAKLRLDLGFSESRPAFYFIMNEAF